MADVEIVYFTDPFCSWCWASEPALFALRERFRGRLSVRHVMGGLVRDMSDFHDVANGIRTTAEVAPHWREVAERSGQPIDERLMLDITDPHWSTWPACVAVKAAELQGRAAGDRFLRRLRRAALTEREQAQREDVQLRLAAEIPGLDVGRLESDLRSPAAAEAFQRDRAECAAHGVSGFPAMLFRVAGPDAREAGLLVGGHRSLEVYERVVEELVPGLERQAARPIPALLCEYGPLTTRELGAITGKVDVRASLEAEAASGRIGRVDLRGGTFWKSAEAR
jgi:putative protein-disulfide isomerase